MFSFRVPFGLKTAQNGSEGISMELVLTPVQHLQNWKGLQALLPAFLFSDFFPGWPSEIGSHEPSQQRAVCWLVGNEIFLNPGSRPRNRI